MKRWNTILVAMLVVQIAIAAVVFWPRQAASGGEPLWAGLEAGDVARIDITDGEGRQIELARAGTDWVLPAAGDYPVRQEPVDELIAGLVALNTSRLVTQTPASHDRLGVGDEAFERRVEIETAGGTRYRLYIGTSPSYGATHVRAAGEDPVYLTSELAAEDASVTASWWVDTGYVSIPTEEVQAIQVENAQGTFELVKEGDTWTLSGLAAGEELDQNVAGTLANRAATVNLLRPLGREEEPAYGLDDPAATVTVAAAGEDGTARTYVLTIGARLPDESAYVVSWSESPYYVAVGEFAVRDFVEKERAGLLVQPTPTPAPTTP
ncbi:MAG: DUF4340 domain-containing protein [Anaerolineae bacterium]|nr:DUF4340 domain-containing protein [Anaerolineae bacterium]